MLRKKKNKKKRDIYAKDKYLLYIYTPPTTTILPFIIIY